MKGQRACMCRGSRNRGRCRGIAAHLGTCESCASIRAAAVGKVGEEFPSIGTAAQRAVVMNA